MGGGGSNGAGDLRGIGIAEVDAAAEHDGGEEQADVREYGAGDGRLGSVGVEGEHDDDAAGTGGDGKGKGIKGPFLQAVDLGRGDGGDGGLSGVGFLVGGRTVLLI